MPRERSIDQEKNNSAPLHTSDTVRKTCASGGGPSPSPPPSSESVFAAAADPAEYRQPDAVLFHCASHEKAAVMCKTAGKIGRNGRQAAIGATVFWCTCPSINNLVARLERCRAVQVVDHFLQAHPAVLAAHCASHAVFEGRVCELLGASSPQWQFYEEHFIHPEDGSRRKYGNAAVSHPPDMKCLHALVGQQLCGAENPIGAALTNYMVFLYEQVRRLTSSEEEKKQEEDCSRGRVPSLTEEHRLPINREEKGQEAMGQDELLRGPPTGSTQPAKLRAAVESVVLLESFLAVAFAAGGGNGALPVDGTWLRAGSKQQGKEEVVGTVSLEWEYQWHSLEYIRALRGPDLCAMTHFVVFQLEGKESRRSKKRRIN